MKSFNKRYINNNDLENFIKNHKIAENESILLQIFTGVCDVEFVENLILTIKNLIPHINIIGSTTDGEIIEDEVTSKETILSFSIFEHTQIKIYRVDRGGSSFQTALDLIDKIENIKKARVAIIFTDGLTTNGELFLNAFNQKAPDIVVAGGLAGDNAKFERTLVFTQDGISNNQAVAAVLYNDDLIVNTNFNFAWQTISREFTVTKAIENRVYSIDNQTPLKLYEKYLGDDISQMLPATGIEFPLILDRDGYKIARAVVAKEDDGSLIFAGNINTGDIVSFGYGNVENIIANIDNIVNDTIQNPIESIFIYSCMARKRLLAEGILAEIKPISNIAPTSGFFTYGEFFNAQGEKQLLNQTMTILTLSEDSLKYSSAKKIKHKVSNEKNYTVKALSHLISQTTQELISLNTSLEQKITQAVEENLKQEKLLQSQSRLAQMGEMISMIAHQWRQPLNAINSSIMSIETKIALNKFDLETKDGVDKCLDFTNKKHNNIKEYVKGLSETIDDFRNFFKPDKQKEKDSITNPIQKALKIVSASMSSKGITIKEDFQSNKELEIYSNELMQVVLNILKNAEDNFKEKQIPNATLTINTYDEDENITIIEIYDNGGGIPEDILPNIFDPYFSTKDEKNGTGLGLYMSKVIVQEHHNGSLIAYNKDDGVCFKIVLGGENRV